MTFLTGTRFKTLGLLFGGVLLFVVAVVSMRRRRKKRRRGHGEVERRIRFESKEEHSVEEIPFIPEEEVGKSDNIGGDDVEIASRLPCFLETCRQENDAVSCNEFGENSKLEEIQKHHNHEDVDEKSRGMDATPSSYLDEISINKLIDTPYGISVNTFDDISDEMFLLDEISIDKYDDTLILQKEEYEDVPIITTTKARQPQISMVETEKVVTRKKEDAPKHPEVKISKSQHPKSKIPQYFQHEKPKSEAKKRKVSPNQKFKCDSSLANQRNSSKQLRFGSLPSLKRTDNEEDLRRRYKSLFRSKQANQDTPICKVFPDVDAGKPLKDACNSNQESFITDEDGSNLLVESGFFDNDLSPSSESHETPENVSASGSFPTLDKEETPSSRQTDEDLLKEAEEELHVNLAIQHSDVRLLLGTISKTKSVRLIARAFQSLVDLSKDGSTHDLYLRHLSFILSCLEFESDALKVEVLKVLINLSQSSHLMPYLMEAKAPANLLKFFLLDVDEEVQLTWLAFVTCLFDHRRRNRSMIRIQEGSEDCSLAGVLFGNRSTRVIRSRVYLLTRHRNRHISHMTREIYADMSRRDGP